MEIKITKKLLIKLSTIVSAMTLAYGFYRLVTIDFDRYTDFRVYDLPEKATWWGRGSIKTDAKMTAYLEEYLSKNRDMKSFPHTKTGIINLKMFFITLYALSPDPSGDTTGVVSVDENGLLYRRLKLYYPEIASGEIPYLTLESIARKIEGQDPSRFRFFLYRLGFIKE